MYLPIFLYILTTNAVRTKEPECPYFRGLKPAPASIMHGLTEMNLQPFISWYNGAQVFHKV